ncbi:MAG: phosphate/phosphite/phosphonate ABC transporter substrate-binding protein [Chloroflexota bacterium]
MLTLTALLFAACSMVQPTTAPLGTEQNPLKLALSPSTTPSRALMAGDTLARLVEHETGLHIKLSVPASPAAVIEAMNTHNVDVAWLGPLAYLRARERGGVQPLLANVQAGSHTRTAQIIVRADSGIRRLEDLRGKWFAYVEVASPSGYLFPRALLVSRGFEPGSFFARTTFAGSHEEVVQAVYRRQVDGGATFGPSVAGTQTDARALVQGMLPDVYEQIRVIAQTAPIPNDTLSVRAGVPQDAILKLQEGLQRVAASATGAQALRDLDGIEGLTLVTDAEFAPVREVVQVLRLDLDAELTPGRTSTSP